MKKEAKKETKKERVLSPAEKLRAERFGKLAEEMEQQGYVRHPCWYSELVVHYPWLW